ncbi:MAG: response regulator [bacterium]
MKKQLLFVDDEQNVLEGLKRMLRPMWHEWDMHFVNSGAKALELMDSQHFDILVTDIKMPEMDGAELLDRVKNLHPEVIRIVLSGHAEMSTVIKAMESVHQYLSKPCEANILKETLLRTILLRKILKNEQLQAIVARITSLPSLPRLYSDLNNELRCSNVSLKRISNIVARDLAMTTKILQLVNSPFFGLSRHISDPEQAVIYLGIDTIKTMVLSIHIFNEFSSNSSVSFPIKSLWDHSLLVGSFSKKITQMETSNKYLGENAYIAGMVHDCGKLILAANFPDKYQKALKIHDISDCAIIEAEKRVFSTTHAEVSAYLMGLWGMSDSIVEAVLAHHEPDKIASVGFSIATAVYVSNFIANEITNAGTGPKNELSMDYIERLGLTGKIEEWRAVCHQIVQETQENEHQSVIR